MNKHLVRGGRKNSHLTGRNLSQPQGGAAMCRDQFRGKRRDIRPKANHKRVSQSLITAENYMYKHIGEVRNKETLGISVSPQQAWPISS